MDFLQRDTQPDVDTTHLQHPHRAGAELLPHFGHHLFGQIQQHEPDAVRVEVHLFGGGVDQRPQLQDQFGPRIRRADNNDRPPRHRPACVIVDAGQFQLLRQVVTQVYRLSGRLQASRVLGETGHVEQPGHRPRRQDKAIPRQAAHALFGIGEGDCAPGEVHAVHPAADLPHTTEHVGERDRDEAGVDHSACHIG